MNQLPSKFQKLRQLVAHVFAVSQFDYYLVSSKDNKWEKIIMTTKLNRRSLLQSLVASSALTGVLFPNFSAATKTRPSHASSDLFSDKSAAIRIGA